MRPLPRARELQDAWRAHLRSSSDGVGDVDAVVGLAGSFTIEPLLPYLGARLLAAGIGRPELLFANYNQLLRVCRDPSSEFTRVPDTIILLCRLEDIADPGDPAKTQAARDVLLGAVRNLRDEFNGTIILGLPPRPRAFVDGLVEFANPTPLTALWFDTLCKISSLADSLHDFHTVDVEALIAARGEAASIDRRTELLFRQPYSDAFYVDLAGALCRIYGARRRQSKKCLVVDCDNTLWGGVVGEDGIGGVQLSEDFPGNAYRQFQLQIAALRQSGVFVALNSKNNPDDVWEMFDQHEAMVLRRNDISASRLNWRTKSENLKEIAAELNIGLDALVFVDDSPFEVEEVRAHVPEVTCVLVPEDIAFLPVTMRDVAEHFDRLKITAEDRARIDMRRHESARHDLSKTMTEDEFLASLKLEVCIRPAIEADLARITQLINKTNQFNVTTRRYTLEQVAAFVKAGDAAVFCVTLTDRFGDYGLVGVGIVRFQGDMAELDSLLMSCRVLGRGVETAMISHAIDLARGRGSRTLRGLYVPTRKNGLVSDLFGRHGFSTADSVAKSKIDGAQLPASEAWYRPTEPLQIPAFLSVRVQ